MGRRHGGSVAAERGGVRPVGPHGRARGVVVGRVAAATQAARRAAARPRPRARPALARAPAADLIRAPHSAPVQLLGRAFAARARFDPQK